VKIAVANSQQQYKGLQIGQQKVYCSINTNKKTIKVSVDYSCGFSTENENMGIAFYLRVRQNYFENPELTVFKSQDFLNA